MTLRIGFEAQVGIAGRRTNMGGLQVSERAEAIGPVATRLVFENDDVKVWEADVAPGEGFPLHQHNYDYVLFTTGAAVLEVRDYGREPSTVSVPSHAAIFIPAGGIESYANVGQTRPSIGLQAVIPSLLSWAIHPRGARSQALWPHGQRKV